MTARLRWCIISALRGIPTKRILLTCGLIPRQNGSGITPNATSLDRDDIDGFGPEKYLYLHFPATKSC
jgi:hypothetical protein